MFGFFFMQNSLVNEQTVKMISTLLITASVTSLLGAAHSHSLAQLILGLYLSILACDFNISKCKMQHKSNRPLMKNHFLIPLFLTITAATLAFGVVFRLDSIRTVPIKSSSMLISSTLVLSLIVFTLIRLLYKNNHLHTGLKKFKRTLLIASPILLTSISAVMLELYSSNIAEYVAACVSLFFILVMTASNIRQATKQLTVFKNENLDLLQLHDDLSGFEGIKKIHSIQCWLITANLFGVKCEISLHNTLHTSDRIVDEITDYLLKKYQIEHISFHVINRTIEGTLE